MANKAPIGWSKYPTNFLKDFTCCHCAPWWWCMTSPIFSRSCNPPVLLLKQVSFTITHIPVSRTHNSLLFTVPGSRAVIILRPGGRGLVVRCRAKWLRPGRRAPSVTASPIALVPLSVALVAQVFSVLQVVCRRAPACDVAVVVAMMVWRQRSGTCLSHQRGLLSRLATAVCVAGFVVGAAVVAEGGEGFVAVKVVTTDVLAPIFAAHLVLSIHRTWNRKKYSLKVTKKFWYLYDIRLRFETNTVGIRLTAIRLQETSSLWTFCSLVTKWSIGPYNHTPSYCLSVQ